jgi:NitT/TauT family transport system substrate-binding protein
MTRLSMLMNSYYSGANAWFALAEERGFFADEGVKLDITAGNGAFRAPRMLVDGSYDLTFGDMCSLIGLAAEIGTAAPIAIYVLHHRSPSAIAVPIDSPIHTPADLEGRHIIGHLSDVAMRSFPAYARASGIDVAKVSTAISDDVMADMLKTMLAGDADGVFGYVSSQRAVLRQSDPTLADRQRFLPFPDVAPDLYGSAIIASRSATTDKADALKAFLRAMQRGLIESILDVPAAIDAVLSRNPALDRQIEIDRWSGTIAEEFNHIETQQIGFGAIDMDRLARSATDLAETIPLARSVSAGELFDARFLPPLADRIAVARACSATLYETI